MCSDCETLTHSTARRLHVDFSSRLANPRRVYPNAVSLEFFRAERKKSSISLVVAERKKARLFSDGSRVSPSGALERRVRSSELFYLF
jgi:hypothetical protein